MALRPRHAVVAIGTNDLWWSPVAGEAPNPEVAVRALVANVEAIRRMCVAADVELTVCSLLPINPHLEWGTWRRPWIPAGSNARVNAALSAHCAAAGIRFLDLYSLFVDEAGDFAARYTVDGVHPNVAAQVMIVKRLRTALHDDAVPSE